MANRPNTTHFNSAQIMREAHAMVRTWIEQGDELIQSLTYRKAFQICLKKVWFRAQALVRIATPKPEPLKQSPIESLKSQLTALDYLPSHMSREERAAPIRRQIAELEAA